MKILVVGDIHGNFNRVLAEVKRKMWFFDHVVFLGDYVDSFDENQNGYPMINGFNRLMEMKAQHKGFHTLIGNHCFSYISDPNVSGHRYDFAEQYREMFMKNLDNLDIACKLGDYVFSHAGISKVWVETAGINDPSDFFLNWAKISREDYDKMDLIEKINYVFHKEMFELFDFDINDRSYCGEDPRQGPLWIRPDALWANMAFEKQIVGHTEIQPDKCPFVFKDENRELIVLDSPTHFNFLELEV